MALHPREGSNSGDQFPSSPGQMLKRERLVDSRQIRLGLGALAHVQRAPVLLRESGGAPALHRQNVAQFGPREGMSFAFIRPLNSISITPVIPEDRRKGAPC